MRASELIEDLKSAIAEAGEDLEICFEHRNVEYPCAYPENGKIIVAIP